MSYATISGGDTIGKVKVPNNYNEAISSPESKQWKEAMDEELKSLRINNTWVPGPAKLPAGRKTISTKWLFVVKLNEKNEIIRFKARLVARGFTQILGIDYDKTFAPVLQPALLRTLLAISAYNNWEIQQIDIKTAFLYSDLEEELYIELPNGQTNKNNIRKLNKSIYGLKQSSRQWNGKFNESLIKLGFERLETDPCCYKRLNKRGEPIFIIIHVDDAIFFGPNINEIKEVKENLKQEYKISDIGEMKYCLGWQIIRDRKNKTLKLTQENYTKEILKRFKMDKSKPVSTPACPNITYNRSMSPKNKDQFNMMKNIPYLEALGCLMYLSTSTRPDISYAVSELSRFASNPGIEHWMGIKRVFRYLNGTINHGINYGGGDLIIQGHVDASYGRCVDTRRSRYGCHFNINNGPFIWKSKMEKIVTLSSMEAEYVGACEASRLIEWIRQCAIEIGNVQEKPTILYTDNCSSKILADEVMVQDRSKHIDIRYHYIREKIKEKQLVLKYKSTKDMPADALTKLLSPKLFIKFRRLMGISNMDC